MSTILVADDERNIRRSLQTTLSLEGYAVETVSDGEQAVAVVERGGIDLLFLDWQMPNLDGLAALKRLREAGVHVSLATDNVPTTLFYPIWHLVARRNMYVDDRIAPEQALSREEALRCATIEGAWLSFEENVKGSIEPGKFADMAVLSDDPLSCPEDDIKDIVAETTIVGGRVVYQRETAP